jgi:hypothetical protein
VGALTSHAPSVLALDVASCDCGLRRLILDPLSFIKDDSVKLALITKDGRVLCNGRVCVGIHLELFLPRNFAFEVGRQLTVGTIDQSAKNTSSITGTGWHGGEVSACRNTHVRTMS